MNDLEARIRDVLEEDASRTPLVARMPDHIRPRVRRRQAVATGVAVVVACAVVAGSMLALRGINSRDRDTGIDPTPAPHTRPVFERTVTVGGVKLTTRSDWYLVDHWATWDTEASSFELSGVPLLEVTNFDAGLSMPVCETEPGRSRLPDAGIAIYVVGAGSAREICGGNVDPSSVRTVGALDIVTTVGPRATDEDRTEANEIVRSIEWTGLQFNARPGTPGYVLDGGKDGTSNWLLEVLETAQGVELQLIEFEPDGVSRDMVEDPGVPDPNAIEGDVFGAVSEDAVRVEYRAGRATPLVARLIDLPPSLGAGFDAYVFESQPRGEPLEVVAIDAEGTVLGSNLPPLVDSERVGTVRAFGGTWNVKLSNAADGFPPTSCVEPSASGSRAPCERVVGNGVSVQTFREPEPAVFVTKSVGDIVGAIDLVSDDGRVFHAVMLPVRGSWVAVIALEGSGRGRFVYHLTDGRVDEGRRPAARVEWSNVGQVIGEGSFLPPGAGSS